MIARADTRHPLEVLADELAREWGETADLLKDHVAVGAARAYLRCAAKLQERVKDYLDEQLDAEAAAEESGYHPGHVTRLIDEGKIPPAEVGHHTVRRRNLPRKPGHGTVAPEVSRALPSRSQVVRSIAGRK